eukprot:2224426-Pleurochrysis_carterae.AAC.1
MSTQGVIETVKLLGEAKQLRVEDLVNDRTLKGVPSATSPPGSWWIDANKPRITSTFTNLPTTTSIAFRRSRKRILEKRMLL